jgi:hypothetical protein
MALTFRKFRNKVTGQVCYTEAGRYGNFKNTIKKLVSYVRYNIARYYIAHLILTVAENVAEIDSKHLHRVLQFMDKRLKRAGSDFKYIAVKEIQERGAIHYHVLCIYSKAYILPSSDEIALSWKLGFVKIRAPKIRLKMQKIANYIGKYIGKGYEFETLNIKKSFTASQIKQIYKLSQKRLSEVIKRFGKEKAETLKCTYRRIFVEGYIEEEIMGTKVLKRWRELIMEFPSEWAYMGTYSEPF